MSNLYFDNQMTMLSAVGTTAVIRPSTDPVAARIADRDHMFEHETAHRGPATTVGRVRSWCRRLLVIAAHNPPHPI
jgi:hypothetical protein